MIVRISITEVSPDLDVVDVPAGIRIGAIQDRIGPTDPHRTLISRHGTEVILQGLPCRVRDIAVARRLPDHLPCRSIIGGLDRIADEPGRIRVQPACKPHCHMGLTTTIQWAGR